MSVNEEIRHKLAEVSANKLSVWAFERWLEPLSWSMHRDLSDSDVQLIGSIQGLFADFDYEGADELRLRERLFSVVPQSHEIAFRIDFDKIVPAIFPIEAHAKRPMVMRRQPLELSLAEY